MEVAQIWLKPWIDHGKEIVLAAAVWWTIEKVIMLLLKLSNVLPPLNSRKEQETGAYAVGFVHSVVATILGLYALLETGSPIFDDHVYGSSSWSTWCLTISSG